MPNAEAQERYRETLSKLLERTASLRAALYLMEPTGDFLLALQCGFSPRDLPADRVGKDHPVLERVNHFRKPFYFNSPEEASGLRPEMERSHTARLLVAPLYSEGELVGFLEAGDKAGGGLFYQEDLIVASEIGRELLRIRRSDSALPQDSEEFAASPHPGAGSALPPPPSFHDLASSPPVERLEARRALRRPPARPALTLRETLLFRGFGSTLLLYPAVEAVVFSHWTQESVDFYINSRRDLSADAREALVQSASAAFARLSPGKSDGRARRFNFDFPQGKQPHALTRAEITLAQTSAAAADEARAILFTLVFGTEPPPGQQPSVKEIHLLVRRAFAEARESFRYRDACRSLIRRFLEPGIKRYSALVSHSLMVARIARQFSVSLKLPETDVEQITVAALLHDVGLRELSYDRLAQKRPLSEAEYKLARDHPAVGAMLLSDVDFPYPVAPLVAHHHEHYDGSGYPDKLRGEEIPFGARLIHVIEAFDAMTSPNSYREPVGREAALGIIVSRKGTQFDPDLALQFRDFALSGGLDRL